MKSKEAWEREYFGRPVCCVCKDRIANRAFKHMDKEIFAHSACVKHAENDGSFFPYKK